jgi:glyoxylate reductase
MFLILGALRGFNTAMLALRDGKWRGSPSPPLGHDPEGKTLGILGMGGIGRNMKKKAEAFGMKTIYYNRNKLSDELAGGAEYVSFDELLARSDVLSLNLPLNVSFLSSILDNGILCSEEAKEYPRITPSTQFLLRNSKK